MERLVRIALKARAIAVYLVLGASSISELKKKLRPF
jgi:DNA segregation ATPase FtsK/SpoIIIE-like protein